MDPRYLSHEADAQMIIEGVRLSRKLVAMPAFQPLVARETRPGPGVEDEAGLLDYNKSAAQTSWHMCETCKMGVDEMAVGDPELKVRGVTGLRVVAHEHPVDRGWGEGRGDDKCGGELTTSPPLRRRGGSER